jgi:toxin-antitoxin system PIN domain toxin
VIIPDINLIVFAYSPASAFHQKAKGWWDQLLSGEEEVGLPGIVLFGFIRHATNPAVLSPPMTFEGVKSVVSGWLKLPHVRLLGVTKEHVDLVLDLLEVSGLKSKLVPDAQLAAWAKSEGAVLHSSDEDFHKFSGIRWINPIREG